MVHQDRDQCRAMSKEEQALECNHKEDQCQALCREDQAIVQ